MIERQLFLGETKVKFAKGFMREKWIKRAKKTQIPTKVEEPPVTQPKPIPNPQPIRAQRYNCHLAVTNLERDKFSEYGLEGQVDVRTEVKLVDVQWQCVAFTVERSSVNEKYQIV